MTGTFDKWFALTALFALGGVAALAADATWIGPTNGPQPWLNNANWTGGVFPGETNNAASLNTDVATITNAPGVNPVLQIDFSPSHANGHLGLGAIVASRTDFGLLSETVRPVIAGGTLTLNGATVDGIPHTILATQAGGIGYDTLILGASPQQFSAMRLGNTSNIIQVGSGKSISIASAITERTLGSGITLTSDPNDAPAEGGIFEIGSANTFTGPVRVEKGTTWYVGNNPQSLGLSSAAATNLTLDNGSLNGANVQLGRQFTLGPGGGRLVANLGTVRRVFESMTSSAV